MDNLAQDTAELDSHGSGLMKKLWSAGSCHQSLPGKVWSGNARVKLLSKEISTMPSDCEALKQVDDYYISVAAAHRNQQRPAA